MDALDDLFHGMRVLQAVYAHLEARAPWGINFREGAGARFGLVVRGGCRLRLEGSRDSLALAAGDCYVLPHGSRYQLLDDLASSTVDCYSLILDKLGQVIHTGGDGAPTTIISGWFLFDRERARPLLSLLPPVIHIRMEQERTKMLQSALQLLAMETFDQALGSGMVVSRLADIIFLQAVRTHVGRLGDDDVGVLAALADAKLSRALKLIHGELARDWTIDALAREVGMSRSAFAAHFARKVGEPPLEYVRRWRMDRAAEWLRRGDKSVGEVASLVGYTSEAAFSKTFTRLHGASPGRFRREAAAQAN
jgi:AraC-like DNA-binding protein